MQNLLHLLSTARIFAEIFTSSTAAGLSIFAYAAKTQALRAKEAPHSFALCPIPMTADAVTGMGLFGKRERTQPTYSNVARSRYRRNLRFLGSTAPLFFGDPM